MAEPPYHRLTRSAARSAFGGLYGFRASLWLGADHVLGIDTTGYTESYKRFYFRDIQAITIRKTRSGKLGSLICGLMAGLLALLAVAAFRSGNNVLAYTLGICGSVALAALLVSLAAGPTCACELRTAVQTEQLPSLNRLRRARKVLNRLRPLIAEAQGRLAPEEIAAHLRASAVPASGGSAGQPAPPDSALVEGRGPAPGVVDVASAPPVIAPSTTHSEVGGAKQ